MRNQTSETKIRKVGLFGTCRISSLVGPGLQTLRTTKSQTTAASIGAVFQDAYATYESQPFNYTTKLQDVIDSVRYLKGDLLGGKVSANKDHTFFSLFCRGYSQLSFEKAECREPGSWQQYDLVVAEVNTLRQLVIQTDRFGEVFRGLNLPWNVLLEPVHRLIDVQLSDVEIIEPSQTLADNMLGELLSLIECPLLVVGPYLLPKEPNSRSLYGEDDLVPVEKINLRRNETRLMLKNSCHRDSFTYFDMTDRIADTSEILLNQYHFSDLGKRIVYEAIQAEILALC